MTVAWWCWSCARAVLVVDWPSGCPANNSGTHGASGRRIDIDDVAAALPSNRRVSRAKKRRSR